MSPSHELSARDAPGSRARASLSVAVAAISWGCWSLFLRPAGLPASVTGALVFAVVGVVTLPLVRWDGPARWDRRSAALLLANAACDAVNVLAFFGALAVTTVGVAVLTHYLAPLLVALLAPLVDRERIRGARISALAALVGLTLVLQPWAAPAAGAWAGAALGAVSAVAYAGNVFIVRRLGLAVGPARAVSFHSLLAALMLAPFADLHALEAAPARALGLVALGGVLPGALGGWLYVSGLRRIGATLGAMLSFLEPIVAVAVGWLAWGERLGPLAIVGAVVVVASGAAVTLRSSR